jgi:AcrR family transcriptional regulator
MTKVLARTDRKRQTGQFDRGPRGALGESILRAAQREFLERGFKGTSIESVAKAAGVAKGTVYLYFDTKEDVFRGVSQAFINWFLERAREAAASKGSVEARLAGVLEAKFGTISKLAASSPHGAELVDASNGVSGDLYRKADVDYVKVLAHVLGAQKLTLPAEEAAWLVFRAAEKSDALATLARVMAKGLKA